MEKIKNERNDMRTPLAEFVIKFKKQKTAIAALIFILALAILSILGPYIVHYGVDEFDYNSVLQGLQFRCGLKKSALNRALLTITPLLKL